MTVTHWVLMGVIVLLFLLNIYQFLIQRAALRIAEILYVMSRNVREKAAEVRRARRMSRLLKPTFSISPPRLAVCCVRWGAARARWVPIP